MTDESEPEYGNVEWALKQQKAFEYDNDLPLYDAWATLRAEVERLQKVVADLHEDRATSQQPRLREEIERLQQLVADQALTIGVLKDESGRVHAAYNFEGYQTELGRLREEAQTSRLALDVAMKEVEAQKESKDRAYKERNQLVAALSRIFESHLMRHPEDDASWERDWMWIVCIHAPIVGQMTWHLHDSDLPLFKHLQEGPNHWDGHTTEQKYRRLGGLPFFEVMPMGPYRTFTITGVEAERNMASDEGVQQRKALSESQWPDAADGSKNGI